MQAGRRMERMKGKPLDEDRLKVMEKAANEAIEMEAKKANAKLGYITIKLYGEGGREPEYKLSFRQYNDRLLVDSHIQQHVESMLNHEFNQFQTDHAFPIGLQVEDLEDAGSLEADGNILHPRELILKGE